jgi:hypothetical protein
LSEEFFVIVSGGFRFDVTVIVTAKGNQQMGSKQNGEVQNNELKEITRSDKTGL